MSNETKPQEVILIPVDEEDHVLLHSDLKIEDVDSRYQTVRDQKGVVMNLPPGDYKVRVFLRNMEMRTIPVRITTGMTVYKFRVPKEQSKVPPSPSSAEIAESTNVGRPVVRTPAPEAPGQSPVQNFQEKEKRERVPVSFPVSYKTDAGKWVNTKSLNLSTTGVCIEKSGKVGQDDNLYVRLHVPVSSVPIECPARVVWVKIHDVPQPRMGLQLYLTTNMQASLANWISLMKKS